jgi:hypothetical protein
MNTKAQVNQLWRQFREAINLAYAAASQENDENGMALRDYAENISWSDSLARLLGRESASERQHRSGRPSVPGFSIETASKLIIMEQAANGAKLAIESKPLPSATLFLVCRQTAIESQVIGYLAARFISSDWLAAVQSLDYADLMQSGEKPRTYHIWYHGQPQADAVPFTSLEAARKELARQLNEAAKDGEYPAARIVSIGESHKDIRIETDYADSQQ